MPGIDQILTGWETLRSETHRRVSSICYGGELPQQWTESTIVPANKMDDKIDCQLTTIHYYQKHIT
jgi:hypothetical protein